MLAFFARVGGDATDAGAPHIRVFCECVGVRTPSTSAVDGLVKKIQRVAGVIHVVDALPDRH
jgi:hypothetical protein